MRLYVEDSITKERVFINKVASSRKELASSMGTTSFKVNDKVYSVNSVKAQPRDATAAAMALGGVIGVLGGVTGVAIGTAIGGLIGKSSDDEDKKISDEFNRSYL
ncbi:MAG: hypothetical protein ACJAWL_001033 [Motiliproteus sp.]|jgi:hypothetical protein